jgi:hypothetical protein
MYCNGRVRVEMPEREWASMIIIPIKRVVRIRISAEIVATTAPAWVTSKKKKMVKTKS